MEKIKLYLLSTSSKTFEQISTSMTLTPEEERIINKASTEDRRKERLASLYLKKKYIGEYEIGEFGKPIAKHIYFNISHTKGLVILGTCKDVPIGVDVEYIRPINPRLKKAYFHGEDNADDLEFFNIWTNKESLLKCVGIGLNKDSDEYIELPDEALRRHLTGERRCETFKHGDYVISITLNTSEPFEIEKIEL